MLVAPPFWSWASLPLWWVEPACRLTALAQCQQVWTGLQPSYKHLPCPCLLPAAGCASVATADEPLVGGDPAGPLLPATGTADCACHHRHHSPQLVLHEAVQAQQLADTWLPARHLICPSTALCIRLCLASLTHSFLLAIQSSHHYPSRCATCARRMF